MKLLCLAALFALSLNSQAASVATNIHDFTMLSIKAPKRVAITQGGTATKPVKITIQNIGGHEEVVQDIDIFGQFVTLQITPLGACSTPTQEQQAPKKSFPITIGLKKKMTVVFNVTFDCPGDYRYFGSVYHSHLGGPLDDVGYNDNCPRDPGVVPGDKGCGSKIPATHQLGGEVLTHVFVK